jgi:hypothetical protein
MDEKETRKRMFANLESLTGIREKHWKVSKWLFDEPRDLCDLVVTNTDGITVEVYADYRAVVFTVNGTRFDSREQFESLTRN